MGHGQGVEHPQMVALASLYRGENPTIGDELVHRHDYTTNQKIIAAALMLGRLDGKSSPVAALANLAEQRRVGHMSSEPDGVKRNELFAPAPHSVLIYFPMACITLWSRDNLHTQAVQWWADHFSLVSAFWTPSGLVAPCGRFKWPPNTAPRPDHTLDNLAYAKYAGLSGNFGKTSDVAMMAILSMLNKMGDEIRAAKPDPIVAVQIGRWALDNDRHLAAFMGKPPTNDPLAWVLADSSGEILDAGKSLDNMPTPPPVEPVLVGRLPRSTAQPPITTPTVTPTIPSADPPVSGPPPVDPPSPPRRDPKHIAADILRIQVAGKDRIHLREIAMEVTGAVRPWRSWDEVADDLLSLGPNHSDVKSLAGEVRMMK